MTQELYIPKGCKPLSEVVNIPQIRLGLQGYGGTGKTWAALTFPNPIVANLDRGLGAHIGRPDVHEVPFYDVSFCKSIMPTYKLFNLHEVLKTWLETEGLKLKANQTLIVDSNTQIQNAYHAWFEENKFSYLNTAGKVDGFAEYKVKKQFYTEILELFKALPCHVVYICHESEASIGKNSGKIRPLLSGQVADELMTYFTDFFRQLTSDKPKDYTTVDAATCRLWGVTSGKELEEMFKQFPRNTVYYWQSEGDSNFDGKCSSLVNFPRFIPANFSSFEKYRRKIS